MSVYAVAWAKMQRTGDPVQKHVLIAVADYADENGVCWPSQQRLAFDTELNERTIRRALQGLTGKFLDRTSRPPQPNGKRQTDLIRLRMRPPVTVSGGPKTTGHTVQNHRSESPANHHRNHHVSYHIQGEEGLRLATEGDRGTRPALAEDEL